MAGFINLPPNNLGDANVYSYLYQMAEQMNYALRNLESGTVRPNKDGTGTEIVYTSSDGTETAYDNETFNELRALIIKTGDAVKTFSSSFTERVDGVETVTEQLQTSVYDNYDAIQSINLSLSTDYVSSSNFGDYLNTQTLDMGVDSSGITQKFTIFEAIKNIDEDVAGFSSWANISQDYIKSGYLYDDSDGRPVIGVAVGELKNVVAVEDGNGTSIMDQTDSVLACYTARKVSYMQKGIEHAYLGGEDGLGVNKARINGSLTVGGYRIEPESDGGMVMKWVGD